MKDVGFSNCVENESDVSFYCVKSPENIQKNLTFHFSSPHMWTSMVQKFGSTKSDAFLIDNLLSKSPLQEFHHENTLLDNEMGSTSENKAALHSAFHQNRAKSDPCKVYPLRPKVVSSSNFLRSHRIRRRILSPDKDDTSPLRMSRLEASPVKSRSPKKKKIVKILFDDKENCDPSNIAMRSSLSGKDTNESLYPLGFINGFAIQPSREYSEDELMVGSRKTFENHFQSDLRDNSFIRLPLVDNVENCRTFCDSKGLTLSNDLASFKKRDIGTQMTPIRKRSDQLLQETLSSPFCREKGLSAVDITPLNNKTFVESTEGSKTDSGYKSVSRRGRPSKMEVEMLIAEGQTGDTDPYHKCPVCARLFDKKKNLNTHMQIHQERKRYTCDFPGCEHDFAQVGQLKIHLYTHTGQMPFVCPVCKCTFRHSSRGTHNGHTAVLKRVSSDVMRSQLKFTMLHSVHPLAKAWLQNYYEKKYNSNRVLSEKTFKRCLNMDSVAENGSTISDDLTKISEDEDIDTGHVTSSGTVIQSEQDLYKAAEALLVLRSQECVHPPENEVKLNVT